MITREVITGLLIPLAGTAAGSFCVYFMKKELNDKVQKSLTGFASGVMTAASVWSLLIPSMEQSAHLGKWAFLPAAADGNAGVHSGITADGLDLHAVQIKKKPPVRRCCRL